MSISTAHDLCERVGVNTGRQAWPLLLGALLAAATGFAASAQTPAPPPAKNQPGVPNGSAPVAINKAPAEPSPAPTAAAPPPAASASPKLDEAAFAIISERNIFNANRVGAVRISSGSSRRPPRVESFTLVGTMAYEKGVFAFFEGSSSEFTKVIQAEGVIAGHKLADILASSVKLEADGKLIDLPIGSQMRREDAGTWRVAEVAAGSTGGESSSSSSRRNGDSASRRSATPEPAGKAPATAAPSSAEQSEILKRLMERRERE